MFEWLVAKNVTCCFCSNSDIISACFLFVNNFFIFLKSFIADFWNNFSCYRLTLFASLVNSFFYFFILLSNSAFCVRHSRGECYISIVNFRCQPFFYFFSKNIKFYHIQSLRLKIAQKILTPKNEDEKLLTTSFTFDEIMEMIPILLKFNIAGSQGFPSVYRGAEIAGSVVVPRGLAYNVTQMHKFLFDDKDYEPTNSVNMISDQIINITGIQSETEPVPEDDNDNSNE